MGKLYQLRYDLEQRQWVITNVVDHTIEAVRELLATADPREEYKYIAPPHQTSEDKLLSVVNDGSEKGLYERCKSCGKVFYVSEWEKEWFERKNFSLPKRCYVCRKARRDQRKDRRNRMAF